MMQIIIETSASPEGGYRAHVAEGPGWALAYQSHAESAEECYRGLRADLRREIAHLFGVGSDAQFMHAES
jgi:hypothetical protein